MPTESPWARLVLGAALMTACASADAAGPASAPAKSAPRPEVSGVPTTLTDATYARVESLVELRPGDLGFQAVDWRATAYEGLLESQRADKPLLLWLYFGGPRGAC